MLRTFPSPSVKAFTHAKPFHAPTSPVVSHGFSSSPLSSPAMRRGFTCNPTSPLGTPTGPRAMSRNSTTTINQGYFSFPVDTPQLEPAALKSCMKSPRNDKESHRRPTLHLDLIPAIISNQDTLATVDFSVAFSSEIAQYRPVKGRAATPRPHNEEIEWLALQDEAESMRETILEDVEMEKKLAETPVSSLSSTSKLSLDGTRLSLPAFKKFYSLAFRRIKLKGLRPKEEGVIYSTPTPIRTKPGLKLSFSANTFTPGRTIHGDPDSPWVSCRGRPKTPNPSRSSNAKNMFALTI